MIIVKINARVSRKMHKFGIEVPTSIKQAKQIDLKNGNTLWCDGIAKEKYNLLVEFKILEGHEYPPLGWTSQVDIGCLTWKWILPGNQDGSRTFIKLLIPQPQFMLE